MFSQKARTNAVGSQAAQGYVCIRVAVGKTIKCKPCRTGFPTMTNESLIQAWSAGQLSWSQFTVSLADYSAAVRNSGAEQTPLHPADFYLTAACLGGDFAALNVFEEKFVCRTGRYLARYRLSHHELEDITQSLRVALFTGESPSLAGYRGAGPLDGWLRVTAIRTCLDHLRAKGRRKELPTDETEHLMVDLIQDADRAVTQPLLERHRADVRTCIERVLSQLDAKDRTILRLHFLDHLNLSEIGRIYGVHRATIARQFLAVRSKLFQELKRALRIELSSSTTEVRSLISFLRADMEMSLERVLK